MAVVVIKVFWGVSFRCASSLVLVCDASLELGHGSWEASADTIRSNARLDACLISLVVEAGGVDARVVTVWVIASSFWANLDLATEASRDSLWKSSSDGVHDHAVVVDFRRGSARDGLWDIKVCVKLIDLAFHIRGLIWVCFIWGVVVSNDFLQSSVVSRVDGSLEGGV